MDLQAIRDDVRAFLDVDVEDLTDALLDGFIREGSMRVQRRERRWPHLEVAVDGLTFSGNGPTPLSALDPIVEIAHISSSNDSIGDLQWVDHTSARQRWRTTTGNPVAYSLYGGNVYIWPVQTVDVVLDVEGYKDPIDWVANGSGAEPDMPAEFHQLVAKWALARGYAQQEDPELSQFHKQEFEEELATLWRSHMQGPSQTPLVLGGAHTGRGRLLMPRGPAFPFDYE